MQPIVPASENSTIGSGNSFLLRLGVFPPLAWGFLGTFLFMIGDGVEAGYLSPYLQARHIPQQNVALLLTVYGVAAAIAAWFSGALSDILGPKRVMWLGLCIWVVLEIAFLLFGILPNSYRTMLLAYGLRGFGYPLFAFGFLIWITVATPAKHLGAAVGWFWFAFTAGLPTLGSFLASLTIPRIGEFATFWLSLGLVTAGGTIALFGTREPIGSRPLAPSGEKPIQSLLKSVVLAFQNKKLAIGCVVRAVNTAPEFGFLVFLPTFFIKEVGFGLGQWLRLLSIIFLSNIIWNLLFGILGDKIGWRRTVAFCGGFGCTLTTLLLYYLPHWFGANYLLAVLAGVLYGATLAGYVPLSALMPGLEPQNKGAAMSILNLGAGMSTWIGPALVGLLLPPIGVAGVMWVFAGLYLASGFMALFLTMPPSTKEELRKAAGETP